MPHAHREQFQQFPAPVFVDGAVVIAVVVQPVNHRRALRQLGQQVGKGSQPLPAEHGNLLGQLRRIVHFGVAGGEQLMPEQGHLFLQGPTGVDHPIDPLGLGGDRSQGTLEVGKVADQVILVDARLRPRIQQFLDGGGIAFGGPFLQFGPGRAKAGPPHQVRHQSNVGLVGHKIPPAFRMCKLPSIIKEKWAGGQRVFRQGFRSVVAYPSARPELAYPPAHPELVEGQYATTEPDCQFPVAFRSIAFWPSFPRPLTVIPA